MIQGWKGLHLDFDGVERLTNENVRDPSQGSCNQVNGSCEDEVGGGCGCHDEGGSGGNVRVDSFPDEGRRRQNKRVTTDAKS